MLQLLGTNGHEIIPFSSLEKGSCHLRWEENGMQLDYCSSLLLGGERELLSHQIQHQRHLPKGSLSFLSGQLRVSLRTGGEWIS
jgi:hypothetical protein